MVSLSVAVILWMTVAALDISAWFWYIWDFVATIFGKPPPRCSVQCRYVVRKATEVSPRILCAKQCCLPEDHGSSFHHCCRVHLQFGGRMSQDEMASWRMFSWGHRVYTRAQRLATATYRLMSKWRIVQLAVVGATFVLWLAVRTGPVASQLSQDQKYPRLPPPITHGFEDPSEMFGMMKGQHVELPDGYHKRAYVYVGGHPVLTTLDTGSFRNAIRLEVLQE